MQDICQVHWLGTIGYEKAWDLQDQLAKEVATGERPPTLLLLEHPHTYTFGRSGQAENLLWDEAELKRRGISVHWVDRGGDVTYHGPGQLVGYPLLPLAPGGLKMTAEGDSMRLPQADYVGYIRNLEIALINALKAFGVRGEQVPGLTGVWVRPLRKRPAAESHSQLQQPEKIAAIGVKVDVRGVSRHGFALNVNPDMVYWHGIVGCGLKDHAIIRLADLVKAVPSMEQVKQVVIDAFGEVFGFRTVPLGAIDLAAEFDTAIKSQ